MSWLIATTTHLMVKPNKKGMADFFKSHEFDTFLQSMMSLSFLNMKIPLPWDFAICNENRIF